MNFINRWILKRAEKLREDELREDVPSVRIREADLSDNRPMTFNIYRASGGTIVELRKYDNRKDQWANNLHVIPDDEDFNDHLSKIITLESLRA